MRLAAPVLHAFVRQTLAAGLVAGALFACGTNYFKSAEKKDPAEDATVDLERGDVEDAINILEAALKKSPANAKLLSLLSLAYAQRAGIEPLAFATRLAEAQGTNGSSQSSATATSTNVLASVGQNFGTVFAALPEATDNHLADLDHAVAILTTQIPAAELQPGDAFKIAIFQSADFTLHLKALDTNGDGIIEASEILNMSDSAAAGLVAQLANAASALGAKPTDVTSQQAAAAIAKYRDQIAAEPGATDAEKLKNFLAANPAAAAAASQVGTATAL